MKIEDLTLKEIRTLCDSQPRRYKKELYPKCDKCRFNGLDGLSCKVGYPWMWTTEDMEREVKNGTD